MLDTIKDLVSTSKHRHSLRITEDLLLAPTYQDGIRKSDMSLIKEALFDFISSCDRNILYATVQNGMHVWYIDAGIEDTPEPDYTHCLVLSHIATLLWN